MIYTDSKLFELLEERRDLKVSFDDEYSFSDVPSIVSIMFVCAVTVESLFNENDGDDVLINFEVFEKSLFLYCSLFNECDNALVDIKIDKDTPYSLAASYYLCKTGIDDIPGDLLEMMCQRIKEAVKNIWSNEFKEL